MKTEINRLGKGGLMKRLLVCLMILVGFGLAGCEEEEHEHHAHEYRHGEHRGHYEYRLNDTTTQNNTVSQTDATVQQ